MSHRFCQRRVGVLFNRPIARDTYQIRLACPELAQVIRPGQFVMLRLVDGTDPLLGRPFALYDTLLDDAGQPYAVDIVYLVMGKQTRLLTQLDEGDELIVWGPLGNGFPEPGTPTQPARHVALVAGGIGQTPFLAHIRELLGTRGFAGDPAHKRVDSVSIYYGVRSAELAAGIEDFRNAGAQVHVASNDGSLGHHGFVTDLLLQHPLPDHIFGCGPEPMLHALGKLASERNVRCHLSLETPMACGIGVCFSCVTPIKTPQGWDYKRVCVDGPIFDAATLAWPDEI